MAHRNKMLAGIGLLLLSFLGLVFGTLYGLNNLQNYCSAQQAQQHAVSESAKSPNAKKHAPFKAPSMEERFEYKDWKSKFWCEVNVADVSIAFFTAYLFLATLVLGIATVLLWLAGERQAELTNKSIQAMNASAEAAAINAQETKRIAAATIESAAASTLQAKAAVGIALPILRFTPADLIHLDKPMSETGPIGGAVIHRIPARYSGMMYIPVQNFGETPAFPSAFKASWQVAEGLPDVPSFSYSQILNHATVIESGEDKAITLNVSIGIELTEQQIAQLKTDVVWLWVYGLLTYTDCMNEEREAKFCWRFADRNFGGGSKVYEFASDGSPPTSYIR